MIRQKFILFTLATLLLGFGLTKTSAAQEDTKTIDEIVAMVGEKILLRSEVNGYVFNLVQQSQIPYTDDLWNEALQNMINQKVLAVHAARDTTIEVTDDQLDQMLDARVAELSAQVGGQAEVENIYGKSIIQVKDDLRDDFRDQLLAEQFQGRRLQQIRITPTEVREWFANIPADSLPELPEAVRMSHIVRFAEVTDDAREDAQIIISAIRDSIVTAGASFEDMASTFSDDPGSASRGGLYSGSRLADFVPEFSAVASRLEPGEISEIFETQFGLHIMRVNDRKGDLVDLNQILIQFDRRKFDASSAIEMLANLKDSVETDNASFAALATQLSEEEFTASRGGRIVDPRTGERDLYVEALGPTWARTLILLEEGQISDPVEVELLDGRRGYHILKLEKRIPEHTVSLDTDYKLIERLALRDKQSEVMQEWFMELREDVFVDIKVDTGATSVANLQ